MWYFSWVLGLGLACTFAILNAMWFEMREDAAGLGAAGSGAAVLATDREAAQAGGAAPARDPGS